MAKRRTLPQDCIVCSCDPCECNKKPEKQRRVPRQRKPEPEPQPGPQPVAAIIPSALNAMRQAAQEARLEERKNLPLQAKSKTDLGDEDALTVQALRALGEQFTLEGEDVDRYRAHLNREPGIAERAAAWRARRRVQ